MGGRQLRRRARPRARRGGSRTTRSAVTSAPRPQVLTELGVAGRRVLWCSMLSQAGQFWPYVCGTVMAGAQLSCADSTYGEAMRVSMFLRLMDYDAVFGVTDALLDGLEARDRAPADVFAGVRMLGAHPGAYERLVAAGLRADARRAVRTGDRDRARARRPGVRARRRVGARRPGRSHRRSRACSPRATAVHSHADRGSGHDRRRRGRARPRPP